jgi:hypothetical protein
MVLGVMLVMMSVMMSVMMMRRLVTGTLREGRVGKQQEQRGDE